MNVMLYIVIVSISCSMSATEIETIREIERLVKKEYEKMRIQERAFLCIKETSMSNQYVRSKYKDMFARLYGISGISSNVIDRLIPLYDALSQTSCRKYKNLLDSIRFTKILFECDRCMHLLSSEYTPMPDDDAVQKRIQKILFKVAFLKHELHNATWQTLYLRLQRTKSLYGTYIQGIPHEIGTLVHVKKLSITYSHLTSLPPEIGNLTLLKHLTLSNNALSQLPDQMEHLTQLKVLQVDSNKFSFMPRVLSQLPSLRKLNMSYNRLGKDIAGDSFAVLLYLTNLKELNLVSNKLTVVPTEIYSLKCLRALRIQGNNAYFLYSYKLAERKDLEIYMSSYSFRLIPDYIWCYVSYKYRSPFSQ